MHVLMESTPRGLSLPAVRERILAVPGVVGLHDLHAWQIIAGLPSTPRSDRLTSP